MSTSSAESSEVDKKLFDAADDSKWEVAVELVVKQGATNSYRGIGYTALHLAAYSNSGCRLIESILRKQPDQINVEDDRGRTPLRRAIRKNNKDCISTLMRFDPKYTILYTIGYINKNQFKYYCDDRCVKSLETVLQCEVDPVASICRDFKRICEVGGYDKLLGILSGRFRYIIWKVSLKVELNKLFI